MSVNGVPVGNPLSAIEALLVYGNDYQITSNGDLAIIQDTPYFAGATIQRVSFLILTNPALKNVLQTSIGEPDDMFAPNYGVGARAMVGRNATQDNLTFIRNQILNGLALDQFIATSPRPTVDFTIVPDFGDVLVTVTFTTVTGQVVTIPDLPLTGANTV